ncbi:MAG: cytochrome c oxidase subunit II [Haloarculaceae archaeon]
MRTKRVGFVALLAAVGLALAVEPAAAQSVSDSTTESLIWGLNLQLLAIAIPITVLVEGILIYTVWRFRDSETALPTQENRRLEITWTVATAIILLFVGVASYQVLASPYVTASSQKNLDTAQEPLEVQVYAQRYSWEFQYPEQGITTTNTMVIPKDRVIRLNITSRDWLHSFHVPGLGLKKDAFPGQSNYLRTKVTDTGKYQLYCAEYCGVGHSTMLGTVDVRTQDGFQQWVDQQQG